MDSGSLRACPTCGLVHRVPALGEGQAAVCTRCGEGIRDQAHPRGPSRAAALAATALAIYPLAISAPVMTLERFGHEQTTSIWGGTVSLLADGHWLVGTTVLVFSVITPLIKLASMLWLGLGVARPGWHTRAVYHGVELIGRWGMLDVLLIAVLVAAVKLGDLVEVTPGVGVAAFLAVVVLSLLSSAAFDPRAVWEIDEQQTGATA